MSHGIVFALILAVNVAIFVLAALLIRRYLKKRNLRLRDIIRDS